MLPTLFLFLWMPLPHLIFYFILEPLFPNTGSLQLPGYWWLSPHSEEWDTTKLSQQGRSTRGHHCGWAGWAVPQLLASRQLCPFVQVSRVQWFCTRALKLGWLDLWRKRLKRDLSRHSCYIICICYGYSFYSPGEELTNILLGNVGMNCQGYQSQMFLSRTSLSLHL